MPEVVRDAVFGNVGTMISFRIGPGDATVLGKYYEPVFEAIDLTKLHNQNIFISMIIDGEKATPFSASTLRMPDPEFDRTLQIMQMTRERYASKRADVEDDIRSRTSGGDDEGARALGALVDQKPNKELLGVLKNPDLPPPAPTYRPAERAGERRSDDRGSREGSSRSSERSRQGGGERRDDSRSGSRGGQGSAHASAGPFPSRAGQTPPPPRYPAAPAASNPAAAPVEAASRPAAAAPAAPTAPTQPAQHEPDHPTAATHPTAAPSAAPKTTMNPGEPVSFR